MFEFIFYSVLTGIILSLVLIGPVYFLLIETSLRKGWRFAIALNLGVILADLICIVVAYFSSKDLAGYIKAHPSLFMIGGFFIFIYGLVMILKKTRMQDTSEVSSYKGYGYTFAHGFTMNLLNIGVILFWFLIVSSVALRYPDGKQFSLYIGIVLATFFVIDLIKIFIAEKIKKQLTIKRINQIRKIIGFALLICGLIVFLKGFGFFNQIDQNIHHNLPI